MMPSASDYYFDAAAQIRMDHWSQGRVVLVGDAGYCASPMSGQGTSLALIGEVFNAFNFANYGCLSDFYAPDTNPATLGTPNCVVTRPSAITALRMITDRSRLPLQSRYPTEPA